MQRLMGALPRCLVASAIVAAVVWWFTDRSLPTDAASWALWLSLGILLVGFWAAILVYREPYAHAARTLGRAASQRRSSNTRQAEADDNRIAGRSAPAAFRKHKSLGTAWEAFSEARFGSDTDSANESRTTVSPADYFTTDTVLGRSPGRLPDALPGVFTAVGLLGTFVGIALGLANIEPSAGTEDLMEGIRTLMGGMSTAFLTSIVGITWSVWWLFEWRTAERRLRIAIDRFVAHTEDSHPVDEPHDTLARIAQAQEHVRDTATDVKATAEEIKGNLQSLGQDMAEALEPYFEKHIATPIRELNTDLGQRQTKALRRMVEEFRATLVSSVKEELNAFGQSLRDASDHQANAAERLERFFDRLTEVSNRQTQLLKSTTEVATIFDRGLAGLREATEALEAASRSARETMAAASDAMKTAQQFGVESRRQLTSLERMAEASTRSHEAQLAVLRGLQEDFGRLAKDLGDKVAEFRTVAAQKIAEVFHVFDSEMAKVVDHLGGTLAELREVTEELPRTVGSLHEAARDLAEEGRDQRNILAEGLHAFEEVRTKLAEQLDQARAESQELIDSLAAAAKEMIGRQTDFATAAQHLERGMEAMVDGINRTGARSTRHFQSLADAIGNASQQFEQMAKAVGEDMQPLAMQTKGVSEGLEKLSTRVSDLIGALPDPRGKAIDLRGDRKSGRGESEPWETKPRESNARGDEALRDEATGDEAREDHAQRIRRRGDDTDGADQDAAPDRPRRWLPRLFRRRDGR